MSVIKTNLGAVTAYADARKHGYTGTREQFGEDQAKVAENATKVARDRAAVEQLTDQTTALTKLAAESEINAGLARKAAQDAQKKAEDAANEVLNQIASKEDLSNKVSAITRENSDDEHYPSTKAVYDAMQEITVPAGRINAVTVNGVEQTIRDKTVEIVVSKETVGLLNVDNTADISKPISTATQTALDTKLSKGDVVSVDATAVTGQAADAKSVYTEMQKMITGSGMIDAVTLNGIEQTIEGKTVNILVDKSTVGLSHVDDTSDTDKPVSMAQSIAIADAKAVGTDAKALIDSHAADKENPHNVTKAQIGLGDVDNTSDADKPISTLTQAALDSKLAKSDVVAIGANVVAGKAADAKSVYDEIQSAVAGAGKIDTITVNGAEQTIEGKTAKITVSKSTVGLGNVDNTADADKPISTATQAAIDAKLPKSDVVDISASATAGQAADAKSVYDSLPTVKTWTSADVEAST